MIRNSTERTEKEEMEKLIQDFERSGYKRDELKKSKKRHATRTTIKIAMNKTPSHSIVLFRRYQNFQTNLEGCRNGPEINNRRNKNDHGSQKEPVHWKLDCQKQSSDHPQLENQKCGATNCL